jgi:hypothetical protein
VACLALGATLKAVQLAVKVNDVRWLQACAKHGVFELCFWGVYVFGCWWEPLATKDAY